MGNCPDEASAPKMIGVRQDDLTTVPDLGAFFVGTLPYGISYTRFPDFLFADGTS
jgi:hypothetical protein